MFAIDLIHNLTGTSLTTFLLCSIELMLAGLCINIPMLRPFYLRLRTKYKLSENSASNNQSGFKSYRTDPLEVRPPGQRNHTAWIELVSHFVQYNVMSNQSRLIRQDDKDMETCNNDDGSSERNLTAEEPSVIHVSKNWSVASTKQIPT
jgi:hypothetical protein